MSLGIINPRRDADHVGNQYLIGQERAIGICGKIKRSRMQNAVAEGHCICGVNQLCFFARKLRCVRQKEHGRERYRQNKKAVDEGLPSLEDRQTSTTLEFVSRHRGHAGLLRLTTRRFRINHHRQHQRLQLPYLSGSRRSTGSCPGRQQCLQLRRLSLLLR